MNKYDGFVGLLGAVFGLVGIGYAMGTHSKMAKISEKLDLTIEELASNTTVDIPEGLVERAVEKNVAEQVKNAVGKATDAAVLDVKREIRKQVGDAVESEYSNIKDKVLEELTTEAAKIDVKRVRADVEKAAKEHALEKFDDNLEDILENFNDQLKNTSKIYTSIADATTKSKTTEGGTVLRIG